MTDDVCQCKSCQENYGFVAAKEEPCEHCWCKECKHKRVCCWCEIEEREFDEGPDKDEVMDGSY